MIDARVAFMIEQKGSSVRVSVHAQPRASRTELVGEHNGALRIRIAAPPVDGAANDELTRFLARLLRVAPSRVHVVSGESARAKTVEVDDIDAGLVRAALLGG